jgi:AraC family transcriptional regulator
MGLVEEAAWYIESRLGEELRLADVARHCGVSRHHLARTFVAATGRSVMRHHRERRLGEAARRLAGGGASVLEAALDAGYGSHEAFTRAFKEAFGHTPEAVRAQGHVGNLALVEPVTMPSIPAPDLDEPRFACRDAFRLAGLKQRYSFATNLAIPAQWRRFEPYIGHLDGQIGDTTYGVCCASDGDAFDYIAGVEVAEGAGLPPELSGVTIPAQRYAVFTHRGHVSGLRRTTQAIWDEVLPRAAFEVAAGPDFERYDARFDPPSGRGVVEIWVPVTAGSAAAPD